MRELIKTIGLFRTKAKNVVALSRELVAEHGGQVPRTREALEALPGVGRKTANVVLNVAFGEPTIAVDTHIFRVGNRTGLAPGKNPLEVEQKLEQVVPAQYKRHAHHWLILHGRYTCRRAQAAVREMHHRRSVPMAGEDGRVSNVVGVGVWKAQPRKTRQSAAIPRCRFGAAGLPEKAAAAWLKAQPRCHRKFKRDAAAGTTFWRAGADLLAKLPEKPKRTPEQQLAAERILSRLPRRRAKRFLQRARRRGLSQTARKIWRIFVRVEPWSMRRPNWFRA